MSIRPLVSHANKGTPCWKASGDNEGIQESVSLIRMDLQSTTMSPTTQFGVLGAMSSFDLIQVASAVGWVNLTVSGGGIPHVIDIYLTSYEDGSPDGSGNIFTGITVSPSSTTPTVNLSGLVYANANGINELFLGYRITSNGTATYNFAPASYSGGTVAYNNQFTNASWTMSSGLPIVLICH